MNEEMRGKAVLITGATMGIGRATAVALMQKGADVTIVGRNAGRVAKTVEDLQAYSSGNKVMGLTGDLSVQKVVRRVADEYMAASSRLDVLINNAGSIFGTKELTPDGIERTWALNHLAYVLLTLTLIDLLEASAPARIINVASQMHANGQIRFADLDGTMRYSALAAYRQSKLANILFTKALAQQVTGHGITVNALHPGAVATGMGRDMSPLMRWANRLLQSFFLSPEKGAKTSVYLASSSSPEVANANGLYFDQCRAVEPSPMCNDRTLQEKLWEVSLDQVKANLLH